ncbi:hypothetical protein AWH62_10320 [Maricaulis sp. W15]|uniref:hypothetical protein n=1 Tax=Maricaulis sp. W15 TaxID=1772333 RepID=UPI000948C480|nr:hypothetical protein [Maricaulis sp. W15]OLF72230.1 hypothetical protein AWH62_10320 [Maricaulis sp. W15]
MELRQGLFVFCGGGRAREAAKDGARELGAMISALEARCAYRLVCGAAMGEATTDLCFQHSPPGRIKIGFEACCTVGMGFGQVQDMEFGLAGVLDKQAGIAKRLV